MTSKYIDRDAFVTELYRQAVAARRLSDTTPAAQVLANLAVSLESTDWMAPTPENTAPDEKADPIKEATAEVKDAVSEMVGDIASTLASAAQFMGKLSERIDAKDRTAASDALKTAKTFLKYL